MHLTKPPAVILQTASTDSWHKVKAFEAGASDYVSKPVDAHELIMRSIIHLERKFLQQQLAQQRERILSELAAAAEIQYQLLPSANKISSIADHTGIEIASHVQFSSELGGDLWGLEHIGTHLFSLYTVDFSGHGLKAALNAFRIHAMMQKLPPAISSSMLALLNDQLHAMLPTGQYATMFYSMINMATRTLSYSTAGAPLPLIVRSDGSVLTLEGKGFPLGCVGGAVYEKYNVPLSIGDKILIYSDALVEQFSNITEKTILNIMRECNGSAQDIINIIVERVAKNPANLPMKDDLTLIALKV
jgi:sigma-B regulation protein RsbU (phosphoserine phosphatase)